MYNKTAWASHYNSTYMYIDLTTGEAGDTKEFLPFIIYTERLWKYDRNFNC